MLSEVRKARPLVVTAVREGQSPSICNIRALSGLRIRNGTRKRTCSAGAAWAAPHRLYRLDEIQETVSQSPEFDQDDTVILKNCLVS